MRRGVRALACALAGVLVGCTSQPTPTRLVLVSDSDIEDVDSIRFTVTSPADVARVAEAPFVPGQPAWLVMEKSADAALGPYAVRVEARKNGSRVGVRRARVWFVERQTMTATVHVAAACAVVEKTCTEDDEPVCAEGHCRSENISPDELTVWDGEPPRMAPVDAGMADAGNDAGTPPDEDAGGYDAGVKQGDPCDWDGRRCAGSHATAICTAGVITAVTGCKPSGLCSENLCRPNSNDCAVLPSDQGAACGDLGLTCNDGVCGKDQVCESQPCTPSCDQGVIACELGCGDVTKCSPRCLPDVACNVECNKAKTCDAECRGDCLVNCTDSKCNVTCSGSTARCYLNCSGRGCTHVDCLAGASCSMVCSGGAATSGNGCRFDTCQDKAGNPAGQQTCPNGLVVCNAPC